MKILLILSYFHPHKGGSQKYAEELYSNLIKLDKNIKVDVVCYNTDNSKEEEAYQGLNIYRVPCIQVLKGQFAIPNYIALFKLLKKLSGKNKYSFVNSHTRFFEHSFWTPFFAKRIGAKSMLTDHCADSPRHSSKFISLIASLQDSLLARFTARNYDVITVTNKATQKFVDSIGIKNSKIIYGGVDTNFYAPLKKKTNRVLPGIKKTFRQNDLIITFLGRMISTKGPDLVLETAREILKQHENVYFVFAGDGPLLKTLNKIKYKNIFFVGSLDKKRSAQLLSNSDILVHPSTHHEGFPNVILEAGASGLVVIATDRGGTKEIIEDGKTGIIIDPNKTELKKAIIELIENKKKRLSLGKSLRTHVLKNFDWKNIANEFNEAILGKNEKVSVSKDLANLTVKKPFGRISGLINT